METAFIIGLFALLVIAAVMIRGALLAQRDAEHDRDDAIQSLETHRRISDATRDPLPAADARERLRRFGAGHPDKR